MKKILNWKTLFAIACLLAVASTSAGTETEALDILTVDGELHHFEVELADTDSERTRGLMYRKELAVNAGMLFDFEYQRPVAMWMVNTYIPLDMLFIDKTGRIVRIAQNTKPKSRKRIRSGEPVLAVLELNAGIAAALGLAPGDQVLHPLFGMQDSKPDPQ